VSLLSLDSWLLYLTPDKVQVVHLHGWRKRIVGLHQMPVKGASRDDFQGVLNAALSQLQTLQTQSVRVLLSDQFVRYFCFPWRPELRNSTEELALARLFFDESYGANSSQEWQLTFSTEVPGQARLVAAVPLALLNGLQSGLNDAKVRLLSVRTQLVAAVQAFSTTLPKTGWLMSHEPGRLSIAGWDEGGWRWVSSSRFAFDTPSHLISRFKQELILSGALPTGNGRPMTVHAFTPSLAKQEWESSETLQVIHWNMHSTMLAKFKHKDGSTFMTEPAMNEFSQALTGFHL